MILSSSTGSLQSSHVDDSERFRSDFINERMDLTPSNAVSESSSSPSVALHSPPPYNPTLRDHGLVPYTPDTVPSLASFTPQQEPTPIVLDSSFMPSNVYKADNLSPPILPVSQSTQNLLSNQTSICQTSNNANLILYQQPDLYSTQERK